MSCHVHHAPSWTRHAGHTVPENLPPHLPIRGRGDGTRAAGAAFKDATLPQAGPGHRRSAPSGAAVREHPPLLPGLTLRAARCPCVRARRPGSPCARRRMPHPARVLRRTAARAPARVPILRVTGPRSPLGLCPVLPKELYKEGAPTFPGTVPGRAPQITAVGPSWGLRSQRCCDWPAVPALAAKDKLTGWGAPATGSVLQANTPPPPESG